MHMVMQSYSGDRMQLLSSDSSSEDSVPLDAGPNDNIIPLASRTADGLAYLAKVVNEVFPLPEHSVPKWKTFTWNSSLHLLSAMHGLYC